MNVPDLPSTCPVCGAISLAPDANASTLLAVCDVLVLKTLETMGKWIVRAERSRYHVIASRPRYLAHTIWPASEDQVARSLRGAWDVIPPLLDVHGCCDITPRQVAVMLDEYVRDLVITGTAHTIKELAYRFDNRLGLPVYLREEPATRIAAEV